MTITRVLRLVHARLVQYNCVDYQYTRVIYLLQYVHTTHTNSKKIEITRIKSPRGERVSVAAVERRTEIAQPIGKKNGFCIAYDTLSLGAFAAPFLCHRRALQRYGKSGRYINPQRRIYMTHKTLFGIAAGNFTMASATP